MKSLFVILCGTVFLIGGCNDTSSTTTTDPDTTEDPVSSDEVKREITEAIDATGKLAQQTQEEFAEEMEVKLRELDAEIAELEAKADDVKVESREKWNEEVADLKVKQEAMHDKLEKVKVASADEWEAMKDDFNSAWNNLKKAYDDAAKEL